MVTLKLVKVSGDSSTLSGLTSLGYLLGLLCFLLLLLFFALLINLVTTNKILCY